MAKSSRINKLPTLIARIILALAFELLTLNILYAVPTEKDFQQDMDYYRRTAKTKKMNANDRLYILNELRQKYRSTEFDLSDLYAEINKYSGAKQKKVSDKTAVVTKLTVTEGENFSHLALNVSPKGEYKYKHILKKGEKGAEAPTIMLYLYNVEEKLKPSSENFKSIIGAIRQVQINTIASNPPTLRISVVLEKDRPYRVSKNKSQLILTVEKTILSESLKEALKEDKTAVVDTLPVIPSPPPKLPESLVIQKRTIGEAVICPLPEPPEESDSALIEARDVLDLSITLTERFSQQTVVPLSGLVEISLIGELKVSGLSIKQLKQKISSKLSEFIVVPPAPLVKVSLWKFDPNQIFLLGQVKNPGAYRFLDKSWKCFEFISKAGGFSDRADKKNITIHRANTGEKEGLVFNLDEFSRTADSSEDISLLPGDIIEVPETENFIFVIGAVKSPGSYEFQERMKIMQAIYLAGGLDKKAKADHVEVWRQNHGKNIIKKINLKKIMRNFPKGDFSLNPGDRIIVSEKSELNQNIFNTQFLSWGTFFISVGLVLGLLI